MYLSLYLSIYVCSCIGLGRRACSRSCSKQAGKQGVKSGDVEMWNFCCWILGVSWWHELGGRFCFHPCKVLFYFWFLAWVHLVFFQGKVVLGTPVLKPPLFRIILKWYWNRSNFCELFDLEWNRYKKIKLYQYILVTQLLEQKLSWFFSLHFPNMECISS